MKKLLILAIAAVAGFGLSSCEKDEIGGTATQEMAGEWYVTVDAADADGNVIEGFEDLFGLGRINMLTFNTSANTADRLYVYDQGLFWNFKVKTVCDQNTLTFSTSGAARNESGDDIEVTISGGKILPGAGRQNNGSVSDSIVFYVSFSDDPYPAAYGYTNYKVSGIRYSGLTEND